MSRISVPIARLVFVAAMISIPSAVFGQANWLPLMVDPMGPVGAAPGGANVFSESDLDYGLSTFSRATSTVVTPAASDLLGPANPNLLFGNEENPTIGSLITLPSKGRLYGGQPLVYGTTKVAAQLAAAHDSGFVGSGVKLLPSTIALDGTNQARQRGTTRVSSNATQLAVTLRPAERTGDARADFQLDFFDGVQLRQAKGQVLLGGGILYAGKTWTTFMDEYAIPTSISADTTSAGTVFKMLAQLGYVFVLNPQSRLFVALEEPTTADFTLLDPNDVTVQRFPSFVARWQWANSRDWARNSTFHVATLIRGMGREDIAFQEDFEAGWGLSVMAKIRPNHSRKHTIFAGFVGGEGIGNYIFGLSSPSATPANNKPAAVPVNGQLRAQKNYGAHLGYTRLWNPDSATSFGYGYAYAETTPDMRADAASMLQNGWVNHQHKLNELVAVGLEYHYAMREVRDNTQGDTHRFLWVVQLLTK